MKIKVAKIKAKKKIFFYYSFVLYIWNFISKLLGSLTMKRKSVRWKLVYEIFPSFCRGPFKVKKWCCHIFLSNYLCFRSSLLIVSVKLNHYYQRYFNKVCLFVFLCLSSLPFLFNSSSSSSSSSSFCLALLFS